MRPTLVIMAAGMGSRFGGLKQIEPMGGHGELLMEYSVYDAIQTGFGKVLFVIKPEMAEDFRALIGSRIARHIEVGYCYQDKDDLPPGYVYPDGRVKPWGTGHAVLSCAGMIDTPFCVINADDFYGRGAFASVAAYLRDMSESSPLDSCMIGFEAQNTMTAHGSVSRACCTTDAAGCLIDLTERTKLQMLNGRLHDLNEDINLPNNILVSCTMFGLPPAFMPLLARQFKAFLQRSRDDLSKAEFYLPTAINELLHSGELNMKVIPTESRWYGFTYREDRDEVAAALREYTRQGEYPGPLWT